MCGYVYIHAYVIDYFNIMDAKNVLDIDTLFSGGKSRWKWKLELREIINLYNYSILWEYFLLAIDSWCPRVFHRRLNELTVISTRLMSHLLTLVCHIWWNINVDFFPSNFYGLSHFENSINIDQKLARKISRYSMKWKLRLWIGNICLPFSNMISYI